MQESKSSETIVQAVATDEEVTRFVDLFVSSEAPYYFEATHEEITQELLRAGLLVYTRGEFHANFPEFIKWYGYQYHVWMMEGNLHVLFADAKRFALLEPALQKTLLQKQVQLGRGHVFRAEWLLALAEELSNGKKREEVMETLEQHGWAVETYEAFDAVEPLEALGVAEPHEAFDVIELHQALPPEHANDSRVVLLTHDIWQRLSLDVKKAWLSKWLTEAVQDQGNTVQDSAANWQVRPEIASLVTRYAGHFPQGLSANCFAAALGMAIGRPVETEAVIQRWLHYGPFLRSLRAIGYEKVGERNAEHEQLPLQAEDVLVWVNAEGQGIHAAYVLAPDVIFQKEGQAWPQAWRVVSFEGMENYAGVLTQGGHIEVYRRTEWPTH